MSAEPRTSSTLGDLLASRRRRRFVGRSAEIELFLAALRDPATPFRVLHLHGPGGIGKTALLDVLAEVATAEGAVVTRLDGRDVAPSPRAVVEALRAVLDVPDDDEAPIPSPSGRPVLLVDAHDQLSPVDHWLRTRLLPRLPAEAVTVLAGREPPAPDWRADPAWRELLRVVSLRNLGPEDSRDYLAACGVDPAQHDRLLEVTHGHPLGLSVLADVVARGGEVPGDTLAPDVVGTLLRAFVDVVPDGLRRTTLGACAIARVTTEDLLRDALDVEDAHQAFTWLRELSFVEDTPDGVVPHDLARDTLDADLRWRDPGAYEAVFRRVATHVHARLRAATGREQQRAIADLKFLFRRLPATDSPVDWESWGQHPPEPARDRDHDTVVGMVAAAEGEASGAVVAHWWDRQPEAFWVVRDERDEMRGVVCLLELTAASDADLAADPVARAVWDHLRDVGAPRPGEVVTHARFVVDRDAYQEPSPTLNATPVITLQRHLATPRLAFSFLTLHEPERWEEYFALADLHRVEDADVEVGGRRYGSFAHDYRRTPVDDLVRLWTERALARDPDLRLEAATSTLALSQEEFTDEVRRALRDLHRPDLLARNPLLDTRLLVERAGDKPPDADTLERLVREAVDTLRRHPQDDKLLRAVDRTYLRPSPTQEAAAEVLGLPFSTYRRHLTQGVSRVVAWLWDREVYGTSTQP